MFTRYLLIEDAKALAKKIGPEQYAKKLVNGLLSGKIRPDAISLRREFEAIVGCSPSLFKSSAVQKSVGYVHQAAGEWNTSMFPNFNEVVGASVQAQILESFEKAPMPVHKMFLPGETVSGKDIYGGKMPTILPPEEASDWQVNEGGPYPHLSTSEHYIEFSESVKRGGIVSITWEQLEADTYGMTLAAAKQIGESAAKWMEKAILKIILGLENPYSENGTSYNTYLSSGTIPWVGPNLLASNELVDYTDIENVYSAFSKIEDPQGDPVAIPADGWDILVMPQKAMTARKIINLTEVQETSGTKTSVSTNPISGLLKTPIASAWAYQLLDDAGVSDPEKVWITGDFKRAFGLKVASPLQVLTRQDSGSLASGRGFTHDIVEEFKVMWRVAWYVRDPRFVVKSTA